MGRRVTALFLQLSHGLVYFLHSFAPQNYLLTHFDYYLRQLNDTTISFVTVLDQVIHTFGRGHEAFFQGHEYSAEFDDEVIGLFFL